MPLPLYSYYCYLGLRLSLINDVNAFTGAEILLTVSGVPLGNADGEVETVVDQNAIGDQMELQVETETQGDEVTAGEY
jgi:hypothetical protein